MGPNDEIRIRLKGKRDKNGHDYYVGVTGLPGAVDLTDTVFLFFPDEDEQGFGGDLVIARHERKGKANEEAVPKVMS